MKMIKFLAVTCVLLCAGVCAASDGLGSLRGQSSGFQDEVIGENRSAASERHEKSDELLSLDAQRYGESLTITVRFPFYSAPQEGSLILAILDSDGNRLVSRSGNELTTSVSTPDTSSTSEWRASAVFTSVSGMYRAAAYWRDSGGLQYSRTVRLDKSPEEDGLLDYRVLRTPSYTGARMETRALFSTEPDTGSVYIVLRSIGGYYSDRTIEYVSTGAEDGVRRFDFSFPIYNGSWRAVLHWKTDGKSFTHEHEFTISNGSYNGGSDSSTPVLATNLGNCSSLGIGVWLLLPATILMRRKR